MLGVTESPRGERESGIKSPTQAAEKQAPESKAIVAGDPRRWKQLTALLGERLRPLFMPCGHKMD